MHGDAYRSSELREIQARAPRGGAGALPSKTLRETALFLSGYRQRNLDGVLLDLNPELTVIRLLERK